MNIDKAYCLFEQSGTFKNEFIKMGIPAEDWDIQDQFGQTDRKVDLFAEIEKAYRGGQSMFDEITKNDIVLAFFPCIYFCALSQVAFSLGCKNYRCMSNAEKIEAILQRSANREIFYTTLIKLCGVSLSHGFRMAVENPWNEQTYLKANFIVKPAVVDMDRSKMGDYFKKPTAYFFFNCQPEGGYAYQADKEIETIYRTKSSNKAGVCSTERSMISPDYARNWITRYLLGKVDYSHFDLFGEAI